MSGIFYNKYGDCIQVYCKDETGYADRINGILTLYKSLETDEVIGCQIKDVSYFVNKFDTLWEKRE